ncbi:polyketide synthase dehydratase domain-containing protein [Streptomyces sp. GKU 257-1]|nr:polyketide synthase dehydratase domain-containing protein [Streptomyces sp. GKU 257-1]
MLRPGRGARVRLRAEPARGPGGAALRADEALATLELPAPRRTDTAGYRFEPALLDGALQVVGWIVDTAAARAEDGRPVPYLPFSVEEIQLLDALPPTAAWCTPSGCARPPECRCST